MTWLTWRQFRTQAAVIYAALAALAVVLSITGAGLPSPATQRFFDELVVDRSSTTGYYAGFFAVISLPAILGAFWGAPLIARELEAGTHRLAWTQSVTRTRWLATKLGLTALAAMAAAGLLSLAVTWWCSPIDTAIRNGRLGEKPFDIPRMSPLMFDARGIAPIGYAAFAVALGVTAGLLIRRTVPALAVTVAVFVAVQIAFPPLIRAHFAPVRSTSTITQQNLRGMMARMSPDGPEGPVQNVSIAVDRPGAWIIANQTVDRAGRVLGDLPPWVAYCILLLEDPAALLKP